MNDDEKCCCGNCLHHRPSWETGHLSGWHCDNFMADAYGCDTEYDDGEECPDFEGAEGDDPEKKDEKADEDIQKGD